LGKHEEKAGRTFMAITVEYLAIFRRTDSFCDSASSFTRLLEVDSEIRAPGGDIHFKGERTCGFRLSDGTVATKPQRFFHLYFTWDGDPDTDLEALKRFLALLKKVRGTVVQAGGEIETLWNDLSSHYAEKAYPLIHEIENLMRRLIAHFMLVTVGREWAQETLPKAVQEAVNNSKRKDYLNILHTVDFIHLGDILFRPYSKMTPQELFAKVKAVETVEDAKALQEFVPESNWKRYFATLVACEDGYLKSRWEQLYELRCKVAHNALMTSTDLEEIQKLVGDVKPILQNAIENLSEVTVSPEDAELVAETAARTVNETVGEFITCWQELEASIEHRMEILGKPNRRIYSARDLVRQGVLDPSWMEKYEKIRQIRNSIVHGPATAVSVETIQHYASMIRDLLTCVERRSYTEYLRGLSEDELQAQIDSRIADTCHDIVDSDEFTGVMANTNATGFSLEYEVEDIDVSEQECVARISFTSTGEQLEDRPFCGNRIVGAADAVFDQEGRLEYRDVSAELDHQNLGSGLAS